MIDFRPVVAAPHSGIASQAHALFHACASLPATQASACSDAPLDHNARKQLFCPSWDAPAHGLQRPLVRWRFEARFLPELLQQHHPDLYIATANMGLPISRKGTCRWVVLVHDLFQLTEKNYHHTKFKALAYRIIDYLSITWSVYRADAIWCPSKFSAQRVAQYFPRTRSKIRVLPNHVAKLDAAVDKPAHLPLRYWLVVGTREPRKNILAFLQVWETLVQQIQLPDLLLVGDPVDFPQFCNHENIHWKNHIHEDELATLYRFAECLWQPSYAEGFGIPVIEAIALGTPVVVAKGSALDEVAPPYSPRFSPFSKTELQEIMRQLATQPLMRDQQAYTEWARQFDTDSYRQNVHALIQELTTPCP